MDKLDRWLIVLVICALIAITVIIIHSDAKEIEPAYVIFLSLPEHRFGCYPEEKNDALPKEWLISTNMDVGK